ncbi:MAG: 2-oxo acid dehydrogenase subunit E2 [Methylobacteriaceae bacterium]|jgi:pyruvate/2-oxoglutarate dehydrogenase complex dihydrolipoamide acyltransferase (E2) component|nr:2-oxo acid dehydrogenase subunit E2 [Methylobacteriaceae bacterium]
MSVEIRLPQISMTMIDGVVVRWLKQPGDAVREGESLVEIQTDKVVSELAAAATGVVRSIAAAEGDVVPVGGLLCVIAAEGEAVDAPAAQTSPAEPPVTAPAATPVDIPAAGDGKKRASPLARKIAAERGISLDGLSGSGPGGLIVHADLPEAPAHARPAPLSPPAPVDDEDTIVPFDGIRRVIAENLMRSKRSAADVTTVADVNMGAVRDIRKVLPLSYNVFIILAAARALREFPALNALVEEERIILKKHVNINVAVSTDKGLLTPVIHDADGKNLLSIGEALADLAERGREGRLTPADFAGGTFTITNSGVFGSVLFTPIINHPQSAVLGLGRIAKTPVVNDNDEIVPALMMFMSLTYNHRSIDGETAVRFLQRIRHYLEHPAEMTGLKKA